MTPFAQYLLADTSPSDAAENGSRYYAAIPFYSNHMQRLKYNTKTYSAEVRLNRVFSAAAGYSQ